LPNIGAGCSPKHSRSASFVGRSAPAVSLGGLPQIAIPVGAVYSASATFPVFTVPDGSKSRIVAALGVGCGTDSLSDRTAFA
jgi:hypothetical protein